jgi:hypothetical protein
MPPKESSRVSKRTWVLLGVWTVAGIVVGVIGHYTFDSSEPGGFLDSAEIVNGFLFFGWFAGLFVVIFSRRGSDGSCASVTTAARYASSPRSNRRRRVGLDVRIVGGEHTHPGSPR